MSFMIDTVMVDLVRPALSITGRAVVVLGVACSIYLFYLRLLPKPLPGIPYNQDASTRVLGDLVDVLALNGTGKPLKEWIMSLTRKHKSPIVQLFFGPFSPSVIVLSDYRETRDILLRRDKEFGKGRLNNDGWQGVIKEFRHGMETYDPRFKEATALTRDLMSPNFLNTVSAPRIYEKAVRFIDLWNLKGQIAGEMPFTAKNDLNNLTFDIIMAVALGLDDSDCATIRNIDHHQSVRGQVAIDNEGKRHSAEPFIFPDLPPSEQLWALEYLMDSVGKSFLTPSPKLYHAYNNLFSSTRRALKLKERFLTTQITRAADYFGDVSSTPEIRTALESMVHREITSSQKTGRAPNLYSKRIKDELYGYIFAGHDTSHTVVSYITKYLGAYQDDQKKVREALRTVFPEAFASDRQPSIEEITQAKVPIFDAFLEEVLRFGTPVPIVGRQVMRDTQILGHAIPKGTMCFMSMQGATYTEPGFPISEGTRNESSQKQREIIGDWAETPFAPGEFLPERWLRKDEHGEIVFNPYAGPFLSFSTGPRGCFGKRLAYLELRIVTILLVWNFEFLSLPSHLDSWEAHDSVVVKPNMTYVKLRKAR